MCEIHGTHVFVEEAAAVDVVVDVAAAAEVASVAVSTAVDPIRTAVFGYSPAELPTHPPNETKNPRTKIKNKIVSYTKILSQHVLLKCTFEVIILST